MSKRTWDDVEKHDVVELGGRKYRVVKIKKGKKKAEVMVETKGRYASSTVKLSEKVVVVQKSGGNKRGPLHDESNGQRRWATRRENEAVLGKPVIGTGDATVTKPPTKAKDGDPWERPIDRVEKMMSELLTARLVGISTDDAGYYVPPPDITTIASHLAIFHGGIPEACQDDESRMLAAHESQHDEALQGSPLSRNHWHTPTRPKGA